MFTEGGSTRVRPADAPIYSEASGLITLQLTLAELQNLQKFHAARQSYTGDDCTEAQIGYGVERKLLQAHTSTGTPVLRRSEDFARSF